MSSEPGSRRKGVRIYETDRVPVLEIRGRLTSRSKAKLMVLREVAHELTHVGGPGIVLDLGLITRFDSTGLTELVATCNILAQRNRVMAVARIPRAVKRVMTEIMIGPDWVLGAGGPFDSVEAAAEALQKLPHP